MYGDFHLLKKGILKKGSLAALLALALAFLIAGCGDSDSESKATPLTKAAFVKQANAVCRNGDEKFGKQFRAFVAKNSDPKTGVSIPKQEEMVVTILVPALSEEAEHLDDLGAPTGDEDQVDAIIDGLEGALEEVEDDPPKALTPLEGPIAEVGKNAKKYGLDDCLQSF